MREIQPLEPMDQNGQTPVPGVPAGLPAWPLTPLSVWTWATPVIPTFYWNVYSSEQRVKQICLEIGRIEAYLDRLVTDINKNIIYLEQYIKEVEERVAALEKRLEEEVARLDALIAQLREDLEQEIQDRKDADTALHDEISQETQDRIHGDDALHQEISDETTARVHADDEITARLSREEATRAERDNYLLGLINSNSTLINNNKEDIDELKIDVARKLEQDDLSGSDRIVVTAGEDNHVTISSTFDADFEAVEAAIASLQGALAHETQERQQDVQGLWDAVHRRIELGKVLAGPGIKVENDPDQTTVTISSTGGGTGGGKALVAGEGIEIEQDETQATISSTLPVAPAAVSDPPEATGAYSLALGESAEATGDYSIAIGDAASAHAHHAIAIGESSVATEERTVSFAKADGEGHRLTGLVDPRDDQDAATKSYVDRVATEHGGVVYQAGEGISIEGTTISSTITQAPTLTAGEGIMLDDSTPGELEISATPVAPSLSAEEPLKIEDGEISLTTDPAGPVTSSAAGLSVREVTPDTESETETGVVSKATMKQLASAYAGTVKVPTDAIGYTAPFETLPETAGVDAGALILKSNAITGEQEILGSDDADQMVYYFKDGKDPFLQSLGSPGDTFTVWLAQKLSAQVRRAKGGAWETASNYGTCFELVVNGSASEPGRGTLSVRLTRYGESLMNEEKWVNARVAWSVMPLCFGHHSAD